MGVVTGGGSGWPALSVSRDAPAHKTWLSPPLVSSKSS